MSYSPETSRDAFPKSSLKRKVRGSLPEKVPFELMPEDRVAAEQAKKGRYLMVPRAGTAGAKGPEGVFEGQAIIMAEDRVSERKRRKEAGTVEWQLSIKGFVRCWAGESELARKKWGVLEEKASERQVGFQVRAEQPEEDPGCRRRPALY